MVPTNISTGTYPRSMSRPSLTWTQRLLLRLSHPVSMIFYFISWSWGIFYLWNHQWLLALLVVLVGRTMGYLSVRHAHIEAMANTTLGKIAKLHANPFNLTTQLLGGVVCLVGVWMHATEMILSGVSLIGLGHLVGWSKVDASFDLHNEDSI